MQYDNVKQIYFKIMILEHVKTLKNWELIHLKKKDLENNENSFDILYNNWKVATKLKKRLTTNALKGASRGP